MFDRVGDVRARLDRESAEGAQGFVDTDIANAVRLAKRHGANIRYTAAAGWLVLAAA
jgi:hypothetical protein